MKKISGGEKNKYLGEWRSWLLFFVSYTWRSSASSSLSLNAVVNTFVWGLKLLTNEQLVAPKFTLQAAPAAAAAAAQTGRHQPMDGGSVRVYPRSYFQS